MEIDRDAQSVYADVGWFACPNATGTLHGVDYEAGFAAIATDRSVELRLSQMFVNPPYSFASYLSVDRARGGHVRLLGAEGRSVTMAVEFDRCDDFGLVEGSASRMIGWIALFSSTATIANDTMVVTKLTHPSDVAALLLMAGQLRLPDYFRWQNSSDPCRDR